MEFKIITQSQFESGVQKVLSRLDGVEPSAARTMFKSLEKELFGGNVNNDASSKTVSGKCKNYPAKNRRSKR